mmetsp:Transcript_72799/g.204443  ORF Transcript_72799/g.204443 Transcript_72799/m.204443 type:complete len:222 (-) Transcript_72799:133-798(-)
MGLLAGEVPGRLLQRLPGRHELPGEEPLEVGRHHDRYGHLAAAHLRLWPQPEDQDLFRQAAAAAADALGRHGRDGVLGACPPRQGDARPEEAGAGRRGVATLADGVQGDAERDQVLVQVRAPVHRRAVVERGRRGERRRGALPRDHPVRGHRGLRGGMPRHLAERGARVADECFRVHLRLRAEAQRRAPRVHRAGGPRRLQHALGGQVPRVARCLDGAGHP